MHYSSAELRKENISFILDYIKQFLSTGLFADQLQFSCDAFFIVSNLCNNIISSRVASKKKILQSKICPAPRVLCQCTVNFAWKFCLFCLCAHGQWTMLLKLCLSCVIPFLVKKPGIISSLTSVVVWLLRWEVINKNFGPENNFLKGRANFWGRLHF